MISVRQLKKYIEYIERKWGSDAKVCIQARDQYGYLIGGGYAQGLFHKQDGTLFISGVMDTVKGEEDV